MWLFIKHFIPAWLAAFLLASNLHTYQVLNALSDLGVEISSHEWISTAMKDVVGLLPTYGVIIAVSLLLAFITLHAFSKYIMKRHSPYAVYLSLTSIAGTCGIAAALLAMQPILDVTLIAGARGWDGFLMQCSAGLVGGLLFGLLRKKTPGHHS